jgi:hypothetical protein
MWVETSRSPTRISTGWDGVPANLVPAAAVRREGQALFGMIGPTAPRDGPGTSKDPVQGFTLGVLPEVPCLEDARGPRNSWWSGRMC